ncbi:hypothetical protein ACF1AY_38980 [Streptomyces sp. NPDC014776]|uniref:hypothetical protein n=1 Tax=unclassified Streptomyces TaxID=2593676 RepID=UPI003700BB40
MAHTFEDLVNMQRTADEAHAEVLRLREEYGRPAASEWSEERTALYGKAWRVWRERAELVQAAVTVFAQAEGRGRYDVEMDVKKAVRHPAPDEA